MLSVIILKIFLCICKVYVYFYGVCVVCIWSVYAHVFVCVYECVGAMVHT